MRQSYYVASSEQQSLRRRPFFQMLLLLFLSLSVHVDSGPSAWAKLISAKELEYRWSRPAANACDLDLRAADSAAHPPSAATIVVTFQIQPDGQRSRGQASKKGQTADREFRLTFQAGRTPRLHLESCFGISAVQGSVTASVKR